MLHNNILVHNGPHIQQWPIEMLPPSDAIAILNCENTLCDASRRWNHLMRHLSEHVPIAKQCTTVLQSEWSRKSREFNKKIHILIIIHYSLVIHIYHQCLYIKIHFIPRLKPLSVDEEYCGHTPLVAPLTGEIFFRSVCPQKMKSHGRKSPHSISYLTHFHNLG